MGGVHDPVQYGVRNGAFPYNIVPCGYGYLGGYNGGGRIVTVIDDIHQGLPGVVVKTL